VCGIVVDVTIVLLSYATACRNSIALRVYGKMQKTAGTVLRGINSTVYKHETGTIIRSEAVCTLARHGMITHKE
jgi:hypothetical protein